MIQMGLGTVQLGLPYGNRAHQGLMPERDAVDILRYAVESGIREFDTAASYGLSEDRIGRSGIASMDGVRISTKLPPFDWAQFPNNDAAENWILKEIKNSILKIGCDQIDNLYFHRADQLLNPPKYIKSVLSSIVESGLVSALGVSIYDPAELDGLVDYEQIKNIQVPANILDQRFLDKNLLELVTSKKIQLVARSIFLQGVLVEECDLPEVQLKNELSELRRKAVSILEEGSILSDAAVQFAKNNLSAPFQSFIIGVDSLASLKSNLNKFDNATDPVSDVVLRLLAELSAETGNLVDPRAWK